MSERIRNIRDALRSGFDTQIAIGEKSLGLAEQRESRNFQLALEARRERLQKSMQTERLQSSEGIAERGIEARAEEARKDREFRELESQRDKAFRAGQAREQAAREMDIRSADREFQESLLKDERLYQEGILDDAIKREDKLLKEKIARESTSAKATLRAETLVSNLTEIRTQISTLLKDMQGADDETIGLYQSELRDLAKQRSAIEDSLAEMDIFVKTEFEIIDIGKNAFDKFFESSPISQEDLIGLAQDYVDQGVIPGEGEKIRKEINNWLKGQGIDYKDETQDQYVERFIRTLALYKDAESVAPPTDSATVVPDLNADLPEDPGSIAASPSFKAGTFIGEIITSVVDSLKNLEGFEYEIARGAVKEISDVWIESGFSDEEIIKRIQDKIGSDTVTNEQKQVWKTILDRLMPQPQQTGMMNPQGGLLSQQPMMAMRSDMTQGDIDYFSPDAINARLSGMV